MSAPRQNPGDRPSERLLAHVRDPDLAAWVEANEDAIEGAYDRVVERIHPDELRRARDAAVRATAPTREVESTPRRVAASPVVPGQAGGMSLSQAVRFAHDSAASIASDTVFVRGKMVEDETGASVATYGSLRAYAAISPDLLDSADLETHLAALSSLRLHSKTQVGRSAWEAAYAAVRHAYEQQVGPPPPVEKHARVFDPVRSSASGLEDGGQYELEKSGRVALRFPMRREGPRVNDLLYKAGVPRSAYQWEARAGEAYKSWLITDPTWAGRIADAVAEHYPLLAAALRQNAPIWLKATGRAPQVPAARPSGAPAAASPPRGAAPEPEPAIDVKHLDPERGSVPGLRWEWKPGTFDVHLLFDSRNTKEALTRGGVTFGWATRDRRTGEPSIRNVTPYEDVEWWVKVPTTSLAQLAEVARPLPAAHAVIVALTPAWGAARSALKQTREEGTTEEGSWETLPSGIVLLRTIYKGSAQGWHRGAVGAVITMSKDAKGWYFSFKEKRAVMVADALREHYPRLAEALARSFGGVARTIDEEAATCDPLVDMSTAKSPQAVQHPIGRAVIEDVVRALRTRLPHGLSPRPFQVVGIAFAKLTGYRALIGDAMGLGKTVEAIGCIAVDPEQLLPAVVVCPAAVFYNWQVEIQKWLPTVPVHPLATGRASLPPKGWKGIVIVTWNQLVTHGPAIEKWAPPLIIADEAHKAKEPTTSWTKVLAALAQKIPHLLLLTGTPIKNRAIELWSLLRMLDPDSYGSKAEFGREYTNVEVLRVGGKQVTKYEGGKNLDALNARLRCIMVRRLKEDVLDELPPKQRVFVPVEIPKKARADYERAREEFSDWLEGALQKKIAAQYAAEGIDPLSATAEIRDEVRERAARSLRAEQLVKIGYLRRLVGVAKIEPAVEQIVNFVENGEPLVVFCDHQEVVRGIEAGLAKEGIRHATIEGDVSLPERERIKQDFQTGKIDVFIGTQAAKEGITLTRASNTLFVERWWTPGDEEQAEDRIHRIGQRGSVTIWFLHAVETIDDHLRALIEAKRAVAKGAVGGSVVATEEGTFRDLLAGITGKKQAPPLPERQNPQEIRDEDPAHPIPPHHTVQSLLFRRDAWTLQNARHWAKIHGFNPDSVERSTTYLRLRQGVAARFARGSFHTVAISDSVSAVVGLPE